MVREAPTAATQKNPARNLPRRGQPRRGRASSTPYTAAPETVPSARTFRYFTARVTSANLVLMPRKPATTIQNAAPGPPSATATATPPMEPRPTVPDTAVLNAWNGDASPGRWALE